MELGFTVLFSNTTGAWSPSFTNSYPLQHLIDENASAKLMLENQKIEKTNKKIDVFFILSTP
jgi:hypothetical protein